MELPALREVPLDPFPELGQLVIVKRGVASALFISLLLSHANVNETLAKDTNTRARVLAEHGFEALEDLLPSVTNVARSPCWLPSRTISANE